jgi:hypothetical protein
MHMSISARIIGLALSLAGIGKAAELSAPHFFAGWEAGQIEEAFDLQNLRVDKEIINRASVWTLQEAQLAENAKVVFGLGGAYFFVFPRNLGGNPYAHTKRSAFGLTEAHGEFNLWKSSEEGDGLKLKTGIFSYKYNDDARNLGEYLYRTWAYPLVIYTGGLNFINSAGAQLSGLGLFSKHGGFKNDFIVNIQSDHVPIGALSATDIVTYKKGMFTVSAGLMFENFYHPDKQALTPKPPGAGDALEGNQYFTVKGGDSLPAGTKISWLKLNEMKTLMAFGPNDTVILDTGYYTFSSQKAMVRASVNLSSLLGSENEKEFGFYYEGALLGLKNYPGFYEKMSERLVHMVGVNIPSFGMLDQVAFEVEYCTFPFRQSTNDPNVKGNAVPNLLEAVYPEHKAINEDDLKWSFYAQKAVDENFSVFLQVANDHLRNPYIFGAPAVEGFLTQKNHWYWALRLNYAL